MKNLFDFADRELSQDALLRYIIENYNDKYISIVTIKLLKRFCKLHDDETILEVEGKSQWGKIDLSFIIKTNLRRIELYIEDKTFSSEHNQLINYNEKIKAQKDNDPLNTYKIFYKSYLIYDWEVERIKIAGWDLIDFHQIKDLFDEFKDNKNLVISMYSQYVSSLYDACNNLDLPLSNNGKLDMAMWESFFKNVLIKDLKDNGYDSKLKMEVWPIRYGYVSFFCKSKEAINRIGIEDNVPTIEIRSRDCLNGDFKAIIQVFGIKDENVFNSHYLNGTIAGEIEKSLIFEKPKPMRKNFPKTIAQYKTTFIDQSNLKEQFLNEVHKIIDEYLALMKFW